MPLLQARRHARKILKDSTDISIPESVDGEVSVVVKKEIVYSCPLCNSILGLGFFFSGLLTRRP